MLRKGEKEGHFEQKLEKNENVHLAITGPIILKFYRENVGKEIDLKDSLVSRGKQRQKIFKERFFSIGFIKLF